MPTVDAFTVRNGLAGLTAGITSTPTIDPSGAQMVMDFLTKAILSGHGFQTRLGVLTTPVSADVEVTTVAAEMSADSVAGLTLIPIRFHFNLEAIVGTLPQASVKMTATASTAGTAFVPLPLLVGSTTTAASFGHTARAAAAGGVTVVDDAATTTRVIYSVTQAAAGNFEGDVVLYGRGAVSGAGNVYVAVGSVSTGSTYFSAIDVLAIPSSRLGAVG